MGRETRQGESHSNTMDGFTAFAISIKLEVEKMGKRIVATDSANKSIRDVSEYGRSHSACRVAESAGAGGCEIEVRRSG